MKIYFRDIFEIWIQNNENVQEFYGITQTYQLVITILMILMQITSDYL